MNTTIIIRQKLLDSSRHNCWFGLTNIAKGFNVLKFRSSNIIAVLLFITLALVSEKSIAQITAGFELDGNANAVLPNPPDDWDLIYNNTSSAQVATGVVNDAPSSADNRLTVGSKDQGDISTWHWDVASVPDKDDILHAGAALYDGNKIYFFGDRYAISGDAQIGFWLFKNPITTNANGTFNGVHAIGDILLLSNFVNGGGVPVIKAYEWVGSGGSDGTLNLIPVSGTNLYAITNSSVVGSPWPYKEKDGVPANFFPVGGFYEGGINLAGLGFGIDPCFSSFIMETRSSASVSAELKDFVMGNFFTKPQVSVNSPNMCLNGNPVTLTATVQGGVSPFSYLWAPGGATTASITVSPSVTTTYTVTVTAANGCVANPATGTVTVNPLPACSIGDPNPPLAVVICNTPGNTISTSTAIDLNLFTLSWSITPSQAGMTGWTITSGQGTNSIVFKSGLCGSAGSSVDVALTVTEKSSGCVSTCHKTILPTSPQCGASINPHDSLDCIITQVSLTGVANSDNPNPILLWTASNGGHIVSGASTLTVVVDAPGTYTFSVTDAINGCNAFASTTVTQNITTPVLSETHTDVSCNGLSNGSIDLTVSGGKAPYTYLWSTGATTQDINGLAVGSYSVTVTGANGCISTKVIPITQPAILVLSTQKTDVLCFGASTGSITANASGGTAPYLFSIGAGAFGSNNVFNGLAAGTYTIHVKDAHGCEQTTEVTINQPTLLVLSTQKTDALCNGGNGSITASATGGVSPYQFSINAGAFSSNNVFSNLTAGTYTIHVKDANGCEKTADVTITEPTSLVLNTQKTDVLCNGGNDGSITASATGGVPPYMFSINAGAFSSTNVFSNLAAGTYAIHVKDAQACEKMVNVTITEPTLVVLSTEKTDVLCNGNSTGSITASASGGVAPYMFSINAGAYSSTNVFSSLAAGTYTIHVKDAHSCEKTAQVTITEPTLLVLSTQKTDALCNGSSTGTITASASGGVPPYQFSINAGAFGSNNTFSGLAAGTYTIHVKDAHACEKTANVTISEPTLVVLSTQKSDVLCYGESTGNITASASGGVPPYQFSINAGAFSSNNVFSNLAAGTYTIHVKDAQLCEKTVDVTINQPTLVVLSTQKTDVLCNGESTGSITASATGGVPPYLFSINSGAFGSNNVFGNLAAGTYTIHVKDAQACEKTVNITITQPSLVVLSTQKIDVLCNGESTGSITASATGGVTPYVFSINASAFGSNNVFSNLAAGGYTIHVKDANGCEKMVEVTITEPPLLVLSTQKTDVLCFGLSTGIISASATGGVGPYLFAIGGGAFSSNNVFSNLPAGTYTVYVKDANDCQKKADVTLTQPPAVKCLLTAPDPLPVCGSTGNVLTAEVSNAVSFTWTVNGEGWIITAGQGSSSVTYTAGKDSATFTLIVANTNGCKDTCIVTFGVGSCVRLLPFCGLTQGFYGQTKGVACATGERALALMTRLLGAPFGNLVIGKPGHSLTILQSAVNCVITRMPSGGPVAVLPAGNQLFSPTCGTTIPLNNNGRFTNTLLGQTIALGFNLRLDTDLGAFVIPGTSFTTMGALPGLDGKCGTDDDVPVFTSLLTETIPQSVLTAMNSLYSSASVYNLFDLANRALGGLSTGGADLKEINAAVSAINEGFDGCRFIEVNAKKISSTGKPKDDKTNTIVSKAYPNPFAYSSTIEFTTKKDAVVTVTVYTITGTKIADLYSGEVKADEVKQVIFKGESLPNGIYIYRITSGDKVYFDRLVLQK